MTDKRKTGEGAMKGWRTRRDRDHVRASVDVILKLWDEVNARLTLALEQLDKAAIEIERLKALNKSMSK